MKITVSGSPAVQRPTHSALPRLQNVDKHIYSVPFFIARQLHLFRVYWWKIKPVPVYVWFNYIKYWLNISYISTEENYIEIIMFIVLSLLLGVELLHGCQLCLVVCWSGFTTLCNVSGLRVVPLQWCSQSGCSQWCTCRRCRVSWSPCWASSACGGRRDIVCFVMVLRTVGIDRCVVSRVNTDHDYY